MDEEQQLISVLMADPEIEKVVNLSYEHFLTNYPGAAEATKQEMFKTAFLQGVLFSQLILNKGGANA